MKEKWHEFCVPATKYFSPHRVSDDWNENIARKIIENHEVEKLINEWWIKWINKRGGNGATVVLCPPFTEAPLRLLCGDRLGFDWVERRQEKCWRQRVQRIFDGPLFPDHLPHDKETIR